MWQYRCSMNACHVGGGEGLVVNGKRKIPKGEQMEDGEPKKEPSRKRGRSEKVQADSDKLIPKTKICKVTSQAAGALFHVPKMQFQPAIDDGFMLYAVLCEQLNDEDSMKQVALVILYPGSTTVVDAVTVCNSEWKHRSTLQACILQDGCNRALVCECHVQLL